MAKPISRKEKIRRKAKERKVNVQSKKIKALTSNINNLEKRLKKLEEKGP